MIAALFAVEIAAVTTISPILDQPYRLVVETTREVAGIPRHFVAERRLVFRRDTGGLVVEVTLERLAEDAGGEVGRRFRAGAGGLLNRKVRLHLAPDGGVVTVEDEAAVWAALLAGVAQTSAGVPVSRGSQSADAAAPLVALAPDQRRALIASDIAGLFASGSTLPQPGTRPVTVASAPLSGRTVMLEGHETVADAADGSIEVTTEATGLDGATPVGLLRSRSIDPRTGLLLTEVQTTSFTLGSQRHVVERRKRLNLPVS